MFDTGDLRAIPGDRVLWPGRRFPRKHKILFIFLNQKTISQTGSSSNQNLRSIERRNTGKDRSLHNVQNNSKLIVNYINEQFVSLWV